MHSEAFPEWLHREFGKLVVLGIHKNLERLPDQNSQETGCLSTCFHSRGSCCTGIFHGWGNQLDPFSSTTYTHL